ncbi:MAG: dephospho-CoA kinase [Firmicutes bacterium]|nr:dephospho-CoA kinase [Bacillota bacterium]
MKIIGLTGGIASGKSTVSQYLRELGAHIIDADIVARQIVEPGEPAWRDIIEYFGPEVKSPDGRIDRVRLGEKVFADPASREALNRMTHPRVHQRTLEMIDEIRRGDPEGVVVLDVPLLIESGMVPMVDEVWLVAVDAETQVDRLVRRDPLNKEQAALRVRSQMSLEEKKRYATRIIDNQGTAEEARAQVKEYWTALKNDKS